MRKNPSWNPAARKRMREAIASIAEEAPLAAKKLAAEIRKKVDLIPDNPRLYKTCPQDPSLKEMVIRSNYKVLYEIQDDAHIEIMAFIHSRQAWEHLDEDDDKP